MARYLVEYNRLSPKDSFTFLLIVRSHQYDCPATPPAQDESIVVDTDAHTVTFHKSEQKDCIAIHPSDKRFIDAIVESVDAATTLKAAMILANADAMLSGGGAVNPELARNIGLLRAIAGQRDELVKSGVEDKKTHRPQSCAESDHIERTYTFDGRKVTFKTCMACARAAAEGDTDALAMFIAQPMSVRAFIQDFVDQQDAAKATKQ